MYRTATLAILLLTLLLPTQATAQTIIPGLGQGNQAGVRLPNTLLEKNRQDADSAALVGSLFGSVTGLVAGYAIVRIACNRLSETCLRSVVVATGVGLASAPAGNLIGRAMARSSQTHRSEYRPVLENAGIGFGVGVASLALLPEYNDVLLPLVMLAVPTAGGALLGYLNPMEGTVNFSLSPTFDQHGRAGLSLQGSF